jgi:hypothetical protein
MAIDTLKLVLSLASTVSLLCLFVATRVVKRDIREEDGPERRQHVGVFYNLFSTMIGLYALEGVFMAFSFLSSSRYPKGVATKPWDWCYVSGLSLVSINILLQWINIFFAVETWIIVLLASGPKPTFFLRRMVRGKFYAIVTGVATLVHVVCLGVVPSYGKPKNDSVTICSLADEGDFNGFVDAYNILAITQFIFLAGVSARIIWHVRLRSAKHSLFRFARKMVVLPLILCIFDVLVSIERLNVLFGGRPNDIVSLSMILFLACVKGLFIVVGYTIQNSRVRRYFMCRFWKSDEWSNMERIYSSFSDDDEEGETTMSRTSSNNLSNVPYSPYRPPALVNAEGAELT